MFGKDYACGPQWNHGILNIYQL